jgi:hypothetical protein
MPNWKKVIVSGSNAHLNHVTSSGNISGSSTSTGSFGRVETAGSISANGQVDINSGFAQLRLSDDGFNDFLAIGQDGVVGYIKTSDNNNNFKFRRGNDNTDLVEIFFEDERVHISGSGGLDVTSHITASGHISGSSTSTGSFGAIQVGGGHFTSASLASSGGGNTLGSATVSGSWRGELSSSVYLRQVEKTVSGSWRGEFSSSAVTNVGGGVSGSSVSTGSFGEVRVGGMSLKSLTTFSSSVATKLNSLDADIIALSIALG